MPYTERKVARTSSKTNLLSSYMSPKIGHPPICVIKSRTGAVPRASIPPAHKYKCKLYHGAGKHEGEPGISHVGHFPQTIPPNSKIIHTLPKKIVINVMACGFVCFIRSALFADTYVQANNWLFVHTVERPIYGINDPF